MEIVFGSVRVVFERFQRYVVNGFIDKEYDWFEMKRFYTVKAASRYMESEAEQLACAFPGREVICEVVDNRTSDRVAVCSRSVDLRWMMVKS